MQTVTIRLLPDGSGRVCIHWLYRHPEGKIVTDDNMVQTSLGPKVLKGQTWRMACNPALESVVQNDGARILPHVHSDDPRAVTCPKCIATAEYDAACKNLESIVPTPGVG